MITIFTHTFITYRACILIFVVVVVVVFSGEVGDWKNHFTVAQNEMYDQIIEEGLKGSMLKAFDYVL